METKKETKKPATEDDKKQEQKKDKKDKKIKLSKVGKIKEKKNKEKKDAIKVKKKAKDKGKKEKQKKGTSGPGKDSKEKKPQDKSKNGKKSTKPPGLKPAYKLALKKVNTIRKAFKALEIIQKSDGHKGKKEKKAPSRFAAIKKFPLISISENRLSKYSKCKLPDCLPAIKMVVVMAHIASKTENKAIKDLLSSLKVIRKNDFFRKKFQTKKKKILKLKKAWKPGDSALEKKLLEKRKENQQLVEKALPKLLPEYIAAVQKYENAMASHYL